MSLRQSKTTSLLKGGPADTRVFTKQQRLSSRGRVSTWNPAEVCLVVSILRKILFAQTDYFELSAPREANQGGSFTSPARPRAGAPRHRARGTHFSRKTLPLPAPMSAERRPSYPHQHFRSQIDSRYDERLSFCRYFPELQLILEQRGCTRYHILGDWRCVVRLEADVNPVPR